MIAVGKKFQEGDIYLAEMLLAAEIFKEILAILELELTLVRSLEHRGSVILATPKGDIHDLGKNIFATLLSSQGFKVYDLGVDVDPVLVVNKVKEVKPDFVGFSALITTSFASMKRLSDVFNKEGLRSGFKLMVGGGVTTSILKEHIGADFQTTNAMEGVNYCMQVMAEKGGSHDQLPSGYMLGQEHSVFQETAQKVCYP